MVMSFYPDTDGPFIVPDAEKLPTTIADTTLLASLISGGWEPKHNVLDSLPALVAFHKEELAFRSDYKAVIRAMRGA